MSRKIQSVYSSYPLTYNRSNVDRQMPTDSAVEAVQKQTQ